MQQQPFSAKVNNYIVLSNFFEHGADSNEQARRKALFSENDLAITRDARFEAEFGQYPVLNLNFSVRKSIVFLTWTLM